MNALQLLILSALAAASVHCATKKVKIKLYKIRRQNKALKPEKASSSSSSAAGQQTPRRQLNVDQLIEHGEQLIRATVQQMEENNDHQLPEAASMLNLELTMYGNLVASLARCQAQPKSCPRLNFHSLHETLRRMAYYERRIHEEVDIANAVSMMEYKNHTISQAELLSEAVALEGQTRAQLLAGNEEEDNNFISRQRAPLRLDSAYALYLLRQQITRVGQYRTADYAQRAVQETQALERIRQSVRRLVRRIERAL
ncbi:hypothetical protein TYRP_014943 [Tyrophagus putrescentiae]|nr:hypothetical protein TYRP_014943 [Tyrophagus putrescentiae]